MTHGSGGDPQKFSIPREVWRGLAASGTWICTRRQRSRVTRECQSVAGFREKPKRQLSAGCFPVGFQASRKGKGLILLQREPESRKPSGRAERGTRQGDTSLPGDPSRGDGGEMGVSRLREWFAQPVLCPPGMGMGGCEGAAEHPRRQAALDGAFREQSYRAGRVSLWERLLSNLAREQE